MLIRKFKTYLCYVIYVKFDRWREGQIWPLFLVLIPYITQALLHHHPIPLHFLTPLNPQTPQNPFPQPRETTAHNQHPHPSSLNADHPPLITHTSSLTQNHSAPHHSYLTSHHSPHFTHPSSLTPLHSPLFTHPS